jgi:crotonobetainyl-CoA:carnitine CoA-transferase CaiB-like acyl-CoA transferase
VRELAPYDCCVTLVRTVSEVAGCNWLGLSQPAPKLSTTPGLSRGNPPALGQHTREVLLEAGLTEAEIDDYLKQEVIA